MGEKIKVMFSNMSKVTAKFWKDILKGMRKFWGFQILMFISAWIELKHFQFQVEMSDKLIEVKLKTIEMMSTLPWDKMDEKAMKSMKGELVRMVNSGGFDTYFNWFYWLFLFLTFCGVNWLDKVKWFTGSGIPGIK